MKNYIKYFFTIILLGGLLSCEDKLEEEVFSELTPGSFLTTESGMRSLLNSAYSNAQFKAFDAYVAYHYLSGMTSGEVWNRGGSIEVWFTALTDFAWDSNHRYVLGIWTEAFQGIRDANIVLDNINNDNFRSEFRTTVAAEARFLRAWSYASLYNLFGPVPIYTSSATDSLLIPRASEQQMLSFIEQELKTAADNLPLPQQEYGRATKGAALGVLCKHYLNTRQWQQAADVAQEIMNLNVYGLVPTFIEVFSLANEGNEEMLWILPFTAPESGQNINALIFPTDYPLPLSTQAVFAARTYLFDDFVNSFEVGDTRIELIETEYVNKAGEPVQLLGNDISLPFKYEFDPNSAGPSTGNDVPVIRYADILLSRAEALNELNGPNQESIDLINQVRERAGVSPLTLGDFDQSSLREHILKERGWEFFMEGKAREDQIRQGVFISKAQERGKNAQPFRVRFAIPQVDLDANPQLTQNEGY